MEGRHGLLGPLVFVFGGVCRSEVKKRRRTGCPISMGVIGLKRRLQQQPYGVAGLLAFFVGGKGRPQMRTSFPDD